jgi:hypothetical protein
MKVDPGATPVTSPALSTVAMAVSSEAYSTLPGITPPSMSRNVPTTRAVSVRDSIRTLSGSMATVATSCVTSTTMESATASMNAMTRVVPRPRDVTTPAPLTTATVVSRAIHWRLPLATDASLTSKAAAVTAADPPMPPNEACLARARRGQSRTGHGTCRSPRSGVR